MKRRTNRLSMTVSHEMTVALEFLAARSGLGVATQAMVVLRQALDRTIASEAVQIRIGQDRAFRTRDQWLLDTQTETFVTNAVKTAEGDDSDGTQA